MGAGCLRGANSAGPDRKAADDRAAPSAHAAAASSAPQAKAGGATAAGSQTTAGGAPAPRPGSYRVAPAPASPKAASVAAPQAGMPAASPTAPGNGQGAEVVEARVPALEGLREAAEACEAEDQAADLPEKQPDRTVVKAGARPPNRCMSIRSQEAMSALGQLESRLKRLEDRVAELDKLVRDANFPTANLGKAKTELAQMEADAHKLESSGVDNIYTSELTSGKDSAKETKKDQLRRLEALFNFIDNVFSYIQTSASGGATASATPSASPVQPTNLCG